MLISPLKDRCLNRGRLPTNLFVVRQTESLVFHSIAIDDVLRCLYYPTYAEGLEWTGDVNENN